MEGPTQTRTLKFKLFNCLSYPQEIFRIDKYEEQIKYHKTLGYHNGKVLLQRHCQN